MIWVRAVPGPGTAVPDAGTAGARYRRPAAGPPDLQTRKCCRAAAYRARPDRPPAWGRRLPDRPGLSDPTRGPQKRPRPIRRGATLLAPPGDPPRPPPERRLPRAY